MLGCDRVIPVKRPRVAVNKRRELDLRHSDWGGGMVGGRQV